MMLRNEKLEIIWNEADVAYIKFHGGAEENHKTP
jgi:hypothetical protein